MTWEVEKYKKSPAGIAVGLFIEFSKNSVYSALGASSTAVVSAAGASVSAASAFVDLRERRVAFFFVAVLAMFSSKSTSSMKQMGAASPWRVPSLMMRV